MRNCINIGWRYSPATCLLKSSILNSVTGMPGLYRWHASRTTLQPMRTTRSLIMKVVSVSLHVSFSCGSSNRSILFLRSSSTKDTSKNTSLRSLIHMTVRICFIIQRKASTIGLSCRTSSLLCSIARLWQKVKIHLTTVVFEATSKKGSCAMVIT